MLIRWAMLVLLCTLLSGCGQGEYDSRMDKTIQGLGVEAPPVEEEKPKKANSEEDFLDPDAI